MFLLTAQSRYRNITIDLPKIDYNLYNKYDKKQKKLIYECRYTASIGEKQLINVLVGGGL
jgi:hypothetical protein